MLNKNVVLAWLLSSARSLASSARPMRASDSRPRESSVVNRLSSTTRATIITANRMIVCCDRAAKTAAFPSFRRAAVSRLAQTINEKNSKNSIMIHMMVDCPKRWALSILKMIQ